MIIPKHAMLMGDIGGSPTKLNCLFILILINTNTYIIITWIVIGNIIISSTPVNLIYMSDYSK